MTTRVPKAAKAPKAPKAPKTLPSIEAVAARVLGLSPAGEIPVLWKEAELKRRLPAAERPLLASALARLRDERRVLALTQGKATLYLFAEPLREWLGGEVAGTAAGQGGEAPTAAEDIFEVYVRLVRQSGGFPDVRIVALGSAAGTFGERLVALWREGRATFSQGDWSLADEAARKAAVELNGERYLLVRLESATG